jgi:tetratricopeptide (TPR) repeat protein
LRGLSEGTKRLLAAVAVVILSTTPVRADQATARAKALFERAETHFSVGEFEQARRLYAAAYKAKQLPALLFNIGQAHWQLGQCKKARFHYQQYLLRTPGVGAARRARVAKLITSCKAKPAPASQPTASSQPSSKPVAPTSLSTRTPASRAVADPVSAISRSWFWIGAGTTAALLATGVVTALVAQSKNDEYLDSSTSIPERRALRDDGRTFETVSWIAFGAATAAAIGSVVLYLLSRQQTERPPSTSLGAAPIRRGALVTLRGAF